MMPYNKGTNGTFLKKFQPRKLLKWHLKLFNIKYDETLKKQ